MPNISQPEIWFCKHLVNKPRWKNPDRKLLVNETLLGSAGFIYVNAIVDNYGLLRIFKIWGNRFFFLTRKRDIFSFFFRERGRDLLEGVVELICLWECYQKHMFSGKNLPLHTCTKTLSYPNLRDKVTMEIEVYK